MKHYFNRLQMNMDSKSRKTKERINQRSTRGLKRLLIYQHFRNKMKWINKRLTRALINKSNNKIKIRLENNKTK